MKNIIYSIFIASILLFSACNDEDIPNANFNTYEASNLKAIAGDEEVSLSWEALEGSNPSGYYVSWTVNPLSLKGGDLSVDGNTMTATITELVNGGKYTFSVQPVYSDGRKGGKILATVQPVSTRIPATNLIAAAGDEKIRLKWTKPDVDNFTEYKLLVSSINDPIIIDRDHESYVVEGLTNDTEYEFSLICVYPNGTSDAISTKATPGQVYPIIVASNALTLNEPCTFEYNDMYFTMGTVQSVSWNFGDGNTSTEKEPTHSYPVIGNYTVGITVIYEDGTSESGSIVMEVSNYAWSIMDLNYNGLSGYVKVSNPVFSPDGRTAYIPTSSPNGHLFAIDVIKGKVKWVYQISTLTYGGGALVGEDGTVYTCGEKDNTVYAINPDGTKKWTYVVDGAMGAFPALSSDGTLYCATNAGTLYAINASTGSVSWNKTTGGTSSAIVVDASNNVFAGTNSAIYKFNASGTELWKTSATVNVTERGSFAMDASGTTLYATQKGSAGLSAIDMATGNIRWTYANGGGGDAYFPIVGLDGTIYFSDKGGKKVYAVNSNGTLKWGKSLGAALTYCGAVLADNGKIYCATQGKVGSSYMVYGLNTATGDIVFEYESAQQFMATASIGPDKRLYMGTIGSDNIGSLLAIPIEAGPETSSWSVRGGDIYGTNRK
ncbi:outer membrane protein assembly factor BamB family protein [Dysgonomonas termitidis]|uniref:PQQ-binding-like beta-propeller repeat protein n=1 Tax=Dysgonomonas termitidis TaxID=1516126 RepID=A0ABV9L307_9BACT